MSDSNGRRRTPIIAEHHLPTHAPKGWERVRLTDVAKLESGHTPSRNEPSYWDGTIKWLSLKDIRGLSGKYITETSDHPTQVGIDNSSARVLPKGTVALCRTASVGKAVILGCDMATSQDFVNWVCGPRLLPEYLYYAFRTSESEFDRLQQGTTHKTIYMPIAQQFGVLLPPLPEQRRIAGILDKADAIRRKRDDGNRLTEELLRSTFLEMFGDPAMAPVKPLLELAEVVSGVTKGRKLNGRAVIVPYLRVANVQDGFLNLDEVKTIEALPDEVEALELKQGDIVMTEGGDHDKLGRGTIWTGSIPNCIHQNHVFRVRVDRRYMLPPYFAAFLRTSQAKQYFLRCAKKTTNLASINMTQLRGLPVPVASMSLQQRYADAADRINGIAATRKRAAVQAHSLFGSLVQRAFRGEI
jgi:type I restriction enzyme S subunit